MPRYQLTDEELLAIHQDQIDFHLRELERLNAELETADDSTRTSGGGKRSNVEKRIAMIEKGRDAAIAKAEKHEKKLKAKGVKIPEFPQQRVNLGH